MAQSAGVVYITVLPNMEAFAAEMEAGATEIGATAGAEASAAAAASTATGVEAGIAKSSGGLGRLGGSMGLLLGAAFVAGFGHKAIEVAEEIEKSQLRLEDTFKAIGQEALAGPLLDNLKGVSDATVTLQGDTDKLAANIAGAGQQYFESLGPAAGTVLAGLTQGILNISAKTGKPLSMLQRSMTLAVINTPDKAIGTLRKLGVATDQQVTQWTKLAEAGDTEALRQAEINAITNAYPGAAEASKTAGERFGKVLNDMEATIGKLLIPVMNLFVGLLESKVGKVLLTVTTAAVGLLVVITLLTKAWKFMTDNALGNAIKKLFEKQAATEAATVADEANIAVTEEGVVANEAAAVSEGELAAEEVARTGVLAALTTAQIGANAATALGVAGAAVAGFAIGTLIDKTFDLHDKILNLLGVASSIGTGEEISSGIDEQIANQQELEKAYAEGKISEDTFRSSVDDLNKAYGTSISATYLLDQATRKYTEEGIKEAEAAERSHQASLEKSKSTLSQFSAVVGENITTMKDAKSAWSDWANSAAQNMNFVVGGLGDLMNKSHISANSIAHNLDKNLKDMKKFGQNLNTIAEDGGKGATELVNQLVAAGPAGQHMADVIAHATPAVRKHIEQDIGKSLDQSQGEAHDLENALTGGFRQIAASILVATGKANDLEDALNQIDGTTVDTTVTTHYTSTGGGGGNKKAHGGHVWSNQTYLVGERGPELFRPSVAGMIVPNSHITQDAAPSGRRPMRLVLDSGVGFDAYIEEIAANHIESRG